MSRENYKGWRKNRNMGVEERKRMMLDIEHFIWIWSLIINDRIACNRACEALSIDLLAALKRRAYNSVQLRAVNICLSWYVLYFAFRSCKIHIAMYKIHRTTARIKMSEYITRKKMDYNWVIDEEFDWRMRKEEMIWIILLFLNEFWICDETQIDQYRLLCEGVKWLFFCFFLLFWRAIQIDISIQFAMFTSIRSSHNF